MAERGPHKHTAVAYRQKMIGRAGDDVIGSAGTVGHGFKVSGKGGRVIGRKSPSSTTRGSGEWNSGENPPELEVKFI